MCVKLHAVRTCDYDRSIHMNTHAFMQAHVRTRKVFSCMSSTYARDRSNCALRYTSKARSNRYTCCHAHSAAVGLAACTSMQTIRVGYMICRSAQLYLFCLPCTGSAHDITKVYWQLYDSRPVELIDQCMYSYICESTSIGRRAITASYRKASQSS